MKPFWVSEVTENFGKNTIYINPLPEKYCTFDCVFCPLGERTVKKTENSLHFIETANLLLQMENTLMNNKVDQVFIMPDGEGLANRDLEAIIDLAKSYHCRVKLISNGYILNNPEYKQLLNKCDEVIGELMTTNENDFQKLQRPMKGFTLKAYIENLNSFRKFYKGQFNLSITLLKNYSDDNRSLKFFKEAVQILKPDNIYIESPEEGKLQQVFGVDEATIERFKAEINQG